MSLYREPVSVLKRFYVEIHQYSLQATSLLLRTSVPPSSPVESHRQEYLNQREENSLPQGPGRQRCVVVCMVVLLIGSLSVCFSCKKVPF